MCWKRCIPGICILGIDIMKSCMISFLVPTLGERKEEIERLLNSLEEQSIKDFEIIFVDQSNDHSIEKITEPYRGSMKIKNIYLDVKGLSNARNVGLKYCSGEVIVLSDDDCWYPPDSAENIGKSFLTTNTDVLLTQIYDPNIREKYKCYDEKTRRIKSKWSLFSRSSIEIAFKNEEVELFDVNFGVGGKFPCCEEVDYLIRLKDKKKTITYIPIITVFHNKKKRNVPSEWIEAKGALYAKHFGIITGLLVLVRDLVLKKQNNFNRFFAGRRKYLYKK